MQALVVANGEPPSEKLLFSLFNTHSQLVAVDGGLHICRQYGLIPDLLIGDFDSISEKERQDYSNSRQIYTPDQNKSDLEKALIYLFNSSIESITVCGALGKRIDHTLTNICLLSHYPGKVKFETDTETCFALSHSSVLTCRIGQILSLIPVSSCAKDVVTKGLKWELNGETLSNHLFSISNMCLTTQVSISFTEGSLIVSLDRNGERIRKQLSPKGESF